MLSPCVRQVTHALLTRPPLNFTSLGFNKVPFDLHVLGTPPAFILSQDQTLMFKFHSAPVSASRPFELSALCWLSRSHRLRFVNPFVFTLRNQSDSRFFTVLGSSVPDRISSIYRLKFSKSFQGLFTVQLSRFVCCCPPCCSSDSLFTISLLQLLVNNFFILFSCDLLSHRIQLEYDISFCEFCQQLFRLFSKIFCRIRQSIPLFQASGEGGI